MQHIPLKDISPSKTNPRTNFDEREMKDLAESIKVHGVLEPIIVRARGDKFEVVCGERRLRAAQRAGLVKIPAIVRVVSDSQMLELQIVENVQRADMNAMEEAEAFQRLKDELHYSQADIAARIGKGGAHVSNIIGLLRLPGAAQDAIRKGEMSRSVAYHIARIEDPALREQAARELIKPEWSEENVTEAAAKSYLTQLKASKPRSKKARKQSVEFLKGWPSYLVKFTTNQFIQWRTIVNGRTDTKVWAEAVDIVMRESKAA